MRVEDRVFVAMIMFVILIAEAFIFEKDLLSKRSSKCSYRVFFFIQWQLYWQSILRITIMVPFSVFLWRTIRVNIVTMKTSDITDTSIMSLPMMLWKGKWKPEPWIMEKKRSLLLCYYYHIWETLLWEAR